MMRPEQSSVSPPTRHLAAAAAALLRQLCRQQTPCKTLADNIQPPLSVAPVTMGMTPSPAAFAAPELTATQYHDRYGTEGLLRW